MNSMSFSNFEPTKRQTQAKIGSLVEHLAKAWGIDDFLLVATICSFWTDIVGDFLAKRCRPRSLIDGVLTVAAFEAMWAAELDIRAIQIRNILNEAFESEVIKEVKVVFERQPQ